jgi:hypothetical protein
MYKIYGENKYQSSQYLVVFHPDAQNYERIKIEPLYDEIEIILDWWANQTKI